MNRSTSVRLASSGTMMLLHRVILLSSVAMLLRPAHAEENADKKLPLAFQFSHAATAKDELEKIPFFRVFPGGQDKNNLDASGSLASLKFARGESKLYKEEDAKPGLIVLLRRLVLVPLAEGDYKGILEGEFNAVVTRIPKETMKQLLAGETTDLIFESDTTKGVRPVAFNIKAKTTFRAAFRDGKLLVFRGEGRSTVTHYALTGTYTYESDPVSLGPAESKEPVYIGRPVAPLLKRDGSPETLPILN